jgi:hypothetical protein
MIRPVRQIDYGVLIAFMFMLICMSLLFAPLMLLEHR